MGRLEQTQFPDATTEQTFYAADGVTVYQKDRGNVVSRTIQDSAGRVSSTVQAFAYDANLLDTDTPNGVFDTVHDIQVASTTTNYYTAGKTSPHRSVTDGKESEFLYDYKGRTIDVRKTAYERGGSEIAQASISNYVDNQLFSQESVFGAINGSGDLVPDYTQRTYYGYSANGLTVRTIQTAKSSTTYANNAAVLAATRSQGADPAFVINDAIRDLRGNVVELIAPSGASTFTLYDGLNQAVSQTRGYGTSLALTNSTEYDVWGNVTKTTSPHGL